MPILFVSLFESFFPESWTERHSIYHGIILNFNQSTKLEISKKIDRFGKYWQKKELNFKCKKRRMMSLFA